MASDFAPGLRRSEGGAGGRRELGAEVAGGDHGHALLKGPPDLRHFQG